MSDIELGTTLPIGTIMFYGGGINADVKSNLHDQGWLFCDGDAYVTSGIYEDLHQIIANNYGGTSTKFNVPDLRGRFIRGVDNGHGNVSLPVLKIRSVLIKPFKLFQDLRNGAAGGSQSIVLF